jgi:hypothetical protein
MFYAFEARRFPRSKGGKGMRTREKLWLVGILLAAVGLQTPAAEAQQCSSAYDFATFSEAVCGSTCSQWGCVGYRFTGDACYCTHPTGGGGSTDPEQVDFLPPSAGSGANPPARAAAAVAIKPRTVPGRSRRSADGPLQIRRGR